MKINDKRIVEGCPFCGLQAEHILVETIKPGVARVICPKCQATFNSWNGKNDAIAKWNNRFR